MTKAPKVSVIIPTYNRAWCLQDAIRSVLDQTAQDFELIVVDDGSIDDTQKILRVYQDNPRIHCLFQTHSEACTARNKGIEKAQGEYVAFLDSDDVWLPDKLERQAAFLDQHPEIALVHGYVEVMDSRGNPLLDKTRDLKRLYKKAQRRGENYTGLCETAVFYTTAILARKSCLETIGYFDPRAFLREDLDICLRLTFHGFRMAFLEGSPVARYRYRSRESYVSATPAVLQTYLYIYKKNLELLKANNHSDNYRRARRNLLLQLAGCYYSLNDFEQCRRYSLEAIQVDPKTALKFQSIRNLFVSRLPLKTVLFIRWIKGILFNETL